MAVFGVGGLAAQQVRKDSPHALPIREASLHTRLIRNESLLTQPMRFALSPRLTPPTGATTPAAEPNWSAMTAGLDMTDPVIAARVGNVAHQVIGDNESRFPSANSCASCHPSQYREWSVSSHSYAQISPVFNAFAGKLLKLTNGTNGDFCIRCHTPVGMNLGEPEFMSTMDRNPTSREGITCITCHRLSQSYSKVSGRLAIAEGDIYKAVYGPGGNEELKRVIAGNGFSVNADPSKAGRAIHADAQVLQQISTSAFCGTCHDVNLVNGFRLEEAFSEYKASPATKRGVSCQDCHMGTEPGKASGYATGPAAVVGGVKTRDRKRTNHMFAGPDYSVVHPGIFPHNARADALATNREWLTFDVDAGWGTKAFEAKVPKDAKFPPRWRTADDRFDARKLLDENEVLLAEVQKQRLAVLRAGYILGDVQVDRASSSGIDFKVEFRNGTDGHNVPTGFDAERLVFLEVTVTDSAGKVVLRSGDRDPNGDVRDLHSRYVHNGELPQDKYLFSLQSRFLTRMVRGGEREQVLAINFSPSASPFLRPSTSSTVLLSRPTGARKHRQTLNPLGSAWAPYHVSAKDLQNSRGPYKARVRMIAQMVPVNLLHDIKDVGFDYYLSPMAIAKAVVEGASVLYDREVELTPGR
jgi:hypothetical protein